VVDENQIEIGGRRRIDGKLEMGPGSDGVSLCLKSIRDGPHRMIVIAD
jgi:hypothetical protein